VPGRDLNYRITVDAAAGTAGIRDFSRAVNRELRSVDQSLDETGTNAQRVARALGDMADQAETELRAASRAADALGRALGPELAARMGQDGIAEKIGDLNRMGLSFEEIEADAEQLAAAIKQVDAVQVSAVDQGLGNLNGRLREARENADQSRSVLANMVGNSTQSIAGLGGVVGDLGVGLGQLGEYATEGGIGMAGLASVAGPMAGLALVTAAVGKYMKVIAETKAFNEDRVRGFAEALEDAAVSAGELQDILAGGEDPTSLMARIGSQTKDVEDSVRAVIGTFEDFNTIVQGGADEFNRWAAGQLAAAAAAGATEEELRNLDAAMQQGLRTTQANSAVALALGDGYTDVVDAAFAAGAAIRQKGDAEREAGRDAEFYGAATEDATEATRDLTDAEKEAVAATLEQVGALTAAVTALGEMADARRAAADSTFAARDAERDFLEQLKTTAEQITTAPGMTQENAAALDELALAAGRAADSQVQLQKDSMASMGATQDATDAQRTWNASMVTSARTTDGPMRQAIINYIAQVNGIPPEKVSEILADPRYDTIDAAATALDEAAAPRDAAILADANTTAAEGDINYAARNRETTINVKATGLSTLLNNLALIAAVTGAGRTASTASSAGRGVRALPRGAEAEAAPAAGVTAAAAPLYIDVPGPGATAPVTVDMRGAILGSRYDVVRTVRDAVRDGVRLAGSR